MRVILQSITLFCAIRVQFLNKRNLSFKLFELLVFTQEQFSDL